MVNWGRYARPDLDRAIEESEAIEEAPERQLALQALLRRVADDLPLIPLYNDEDVYALASRYAWRPRNDSYLRLAEVSLR